jgi:hypothetical protein
MVSEFPKANHNFRAGGWDNWMSSALYCFCIVFFLFSLKLFARMPVGNNVTVIWLLLDDNALVKIAILCIQSGEAYSIKAIS